MEFFSDDFSFIDEIDLTLTVADSPEPVTLVDEQLELQSYTVANFL